MVKRNQFVYDEFSVLVSDVEFVVFSDTGFINQGTYHSEKHFHKYNEIVYCYKGTMEIEYNNASEHIAEGDMMLISKETEHSIITHDDTYCIVLSFWEGDKWEDKEAVTLFKNFPARGAYERILDYRFGKYKYKKELIKACLFEIITMMLEIIDTKSVGVEGGVTLENNRYRRYIIEGYFSDRFCDSPKISELAELLHLSVQQTQRIVKKIYNKTFREYILYLKVKKAKNLLLEGELNMTEIAGSLGYNNAHNFFKMFKDETGMTPNRFRKQNEQKC